jgi:hypothetical protein
MKVACGPVGGLCPGCNSFPILKARLERNFPSVAQRLQLALGPAATVVVSVKGGFKVGA